MKRTILSAAVSRLCFMSLGAMGELELSYPSEDAIPENAREYYTEENGAWILTGVKGGGKKNIERLDESLRKERNDHKATKAKFSKLEGLDLDVVIDRHNRFEELEIAAAGKVDDKKVDEIVETRIKSRLATVQRELDTTKALLGNTQKENEQLKEKDINRTIRSSLRKAAINAKVVDTAVDDVLDIGARLFELDEDGRVQARDGVGITPGIDPSMWLSDLVDKKPHWFPSSFGGGGKGGKGGPGNLGAENPFTDAGWNITKQAIMLRDNPEKAKRMASFAGVDIDNPKRPVKK